MYDSRDKWSIRVSTWNALKLYQKFIEGYNVYLEDLKPKIDLVCKFTWAL